MSTSDDFQLQIAREAKAERDAKGRVDERADACLARYERGDFSSCYGIATEDLVRTARPVSAGVPATEQTPQPNFSRGGNGNGRKAGRMATANQVNALHRMAGAGRKLDVDAEICERAEQVSEEHTSFSTASALMDILGGKLDAARKAPAKVATISEKQADLLNTMAAERGLTFEEGHFENLPRDQFQAAFDELKATKCPAPERKSSKREAAEPGLYAYEGTIVKIQSNRSHTGVYAKRLNIETGEYEHARGLQFKVTDKLTLEQATKIYQANHMLHGECLACGRELTDEYSMEVGIGPVCREKL